MHRLHIENPFTVVTESFPRATGNRKEKFFCRSEMELIGGFLGKQLVFTRL